jgi:hypothetical protein
LEPAVGPTGGGSPLLERLIMGEGDDEAAKPSRAPRSRPGGASSGFRRPAKIQLLQSLRGAGTLTPSSGGPVAVTYELDVFGSGDTRSISGALEGDFRSLDLSDGDPAAHLRLADGHDLAIQIIEAEGELAQFEAHLTVTEAKRLSP